MEVNYNYMLAEFCTVEHSSDMSDKEIVPHVFQVWRVAPNKKIEAIKAFRECFSKKSNSISLSDTLGLGEAKRIVEGGTCHLWASKEQIAKFKDFMIARGVAMDIRLVPIAPNDTVEFSYTLTLHFRL
jgi:ribosomal protein L7/L12